MGLLKLHISSSLQRAVNQKELIKTMLKKFHKPFISVPATWSSMSSFGKFKNATLLTSRYFLKHFHTRWRVFVCMLL